MTDFFTMPGGTANLPDSSRSAMSYVQPPGATTTKPDDGAVVRFNTIDWEARAKVAAEGAEGLMKALTIISTVGDHNYFGSLVEGDEVFNRLCSLIETWRHLLGDQKQSLVELAAQCRSAGSELMSADSDSAKILTI